MMSGYFKNIMTEFKYAPMFQLGKMKQSTDWFLKKELQ